MKPPLRESRHCPCLSDWGRRGKNEGKLDSGNAVVLECSLAKVVKGMLIESGYNEIQIIKDYNKNDRIIVGRKS